jgi:hypothetical protein
MKLLKVGRNLAAAPLAWNFLQNRLQAADRHRRRRNWAAGVAFGAGALVAYTFREDFVAVFHKLLDDRRREVSDYAPPAPSRKKQERDARRASAERRGREEGLRGAAAVHVETNASPELAVTLGEVAKH